MSTTTFAERFEGDGSAADDALKFAKYDKAIKTHALGIVPGPYGGLPSILPDSEIRTMFPSGPPILRLLHPGARPSHEAYAQDCAGHKIQLSEFKEALEAFEDYY